MFTPSVQQAAIFELIEHGFGNIMIIAVAGSGKTTTLVEGMKRMRGTVALAAYNKKIADEISEKVKAYPNVKASTFHSFGFSAWRRVAPKLGPVDEKKVAKLCDARKIDERFTPVVCRLVSLAKQHGVGFLKPLTDEGVWYEIVTHHDLEEDLPEPTAEMTFTVSELVYQAQAVLKASIEQNLTIIDFDDMIYAPLVGNARMTQYDWVLIDEAQDTNPARRALAKKMLKAGGRLIAVGDPHQAIYGFTGADNDSLELIEREFHTTRMPLTVSWRCAKSVVNVARRYVSHITAADTAPVGTATHITAAQFAKLTPTAGDAILCRNTKPLIELAYGLIRRRISCYVEGRDIGRGLLALVGKWKVKSVDALSDKLYDFLAVQTQKMLAKGEEMQAQSLTDKVETLLFIIDHVLTAEASVADLTAEINKLFSDTPAGQAPRAVVLSTIHKSKGREWNTVYWYGANRFQPSPFARQTWQQEQETNLMYVAATRAKTALIEVAAPTKEEEAN